MSATITIEILDSTFHVRLLRFSFPEYPYDHFLLVKLPGNRNFLYREESDDFLIWEGEMDHAVGYDRFLFPLIDAVCHDKLTRVDPQVPS